MPAILVAAMLLVLSGGSPVCAGQDGLTAWWGGRRLTGDWFGARTALEDHGVRTRGQWRGIYFGILASEGGAGNAFSQEWSLALELDAAKLSGLERLSGWSAFVEGRWRDPQPSANPNTQVEADSLFNPSRYVGGAGWRLMNVGVRYVAPEFFGVEEGLTLEGGWVQPQREFIDQPLARLFANNAMGSAEGLGGNIPFGSSFSTWGGNIVFKPADWHYLQGGLFMSYPSPTDPRNNGLRFRGSEDGGNGLFFMGETGVTPEIGPDRLPGHYAFGGYYYGEEETRGGAKFGFYWQANQMLWREQGEQGLRFFSLYMFAPKYNNDFSFYTQAGLVYEGLIPGRDRDQLMAGAALGQYSYYDLLAARKAGEPEPTQTVIIEAGYRLRLSGWSFVQPFAQYLVQPDGTPATANAALLGLFIGVDF